MKISIVSKTFRIHDNPFLDSDYYIIYINEEEYGKHQKNFLDTILPFHIKDLKSRNVTPIIVTNLTSIKKMSKEKEIKIFVDYYNPTIDYPFEFTYLPSWCLINWTDKVEMVKKWFLPEALRNHKVFKTYVVSNIREEYKSIGKKNKSGNELKTNYKLNEEATTIVFDKDNKYLQKYGLDKWILNKLKETSFMNDSKWFKPDTSPTTKISNDSSYLNDNLKTSKLSPFIALGVLSPLECYKFWNGEDRMGSGRDQLLFREMFHSCSQMDEFWFNDFGKEYDWVKIDPEKWDNFVNGTTEFEDLNWAMKTLYKEGWIHHLARHLIADYLTRGKLEIHWKHGMRIFKEQLIDHDPCVNRANWMWLSGTAFSTKQRSFYHYNYNNYLKNRDKKLKVKNPNSESIKKYIK